MSSYIKSTDFASKDALLTGNPLKIVSGTEIDDEFNNIQTAINTKADSNSPSLTGTPIAPTAATATSSTQLATTAFVQANKVSPAFTGVPTAPTATLGTATTQLATTLFVDNALGSLVTYALLSDATQNITANNLVADQLAVSGEGLYLTQAKTGWRIYQSGTSLVFSYNGDISLVLDISGNLTAEGNVTGYQVV